MLIIFAIGGGVGNGKSGIRNGDMAVDGLDSSDLNEELKNNILFVRSL